ncbi:MAG TPA: hypothetical protein VMH79_05765 [Thermoanaerobaculia bacterium]|nr:hypothetical protein [Thermoanaerobaculia bacterium]
MIAALVFLALLPTPTRTPTPAPSGPTFCAEWIRQSSEGFDRLTLFRDGVLVWKTHRGEKDVVKRERLDDGARRFYCDEFFVQKDFWNLPSDLRTGLTGELAAESAVTLARADGSRKAIRFDDLSAGDAASSSLRSALQGLREIFLSPLAPVSRFSVEVLPAGTLLRRFDGRLFRVAILEKATGYVEVEGVEEPYSQWIKIEELRYQFAPPEPPR